MTCTEFTDQDTEKARGVGVRGLALGGQVKVLVLKSEKLPQASTPGSRDSRPAAAKDHAWPRSLGGETGGATLRASSSPSTCLENFSLCSRSLRSLEASATASSSCASSCGGRRELLTAACWAHCGWRPPFPGRARSKEPSLQKAS